MVITEHAQDRVRERCGIPKKAVERNATMALMYGVRHSETKGKLKKYVDWLFLSYNSGGKIRIYNNYVYIFTMLDVLITVFPLPNMYKNAANKILKKKTENRGNLCMTI